MRKILLISAIASFSVASAQERPLLKKLPDNSTTYFVAPKTGYMAGATLSHTLKNGNSVYLLPQSNMPCVVPDISQYNMPVSKPAIPYYNIPNPALPNNTPGMVVPQNKIIPITPEKLQEYKELLEKQKIVQ